MKKPGVIIVDDHALLRESLKFMLVNTGIAEVLAEASNGREYIELLKQISPDLVLMDIKMPVMDGIEATRISRRDYPAIKILVISMHDDQEHYNTMIELGVKGFILKESDCSEMEKAINAIMDGKHFFSQELLLKLLKNKNIKPDITLNQREKEILGLLCQGFNSSEIADKLFLSVRTVEKHRSELIEKTGTSNSVSLVVYAIKNKLLEI